MQINEKEIEHGVCEGIARDRMLKKPVARCTGKNVGLYLQDYGNL